MGDDRLWRADLGILRVLSQRSSATFRELFYETHLDESFLSKRLRKLIQDGHVVKVGRGRYAITDTGLYLARMSLGIEGAVHVLTSSKIVKKGDDENGIGEEE